jgi:hypothetical protein
MRNRVNAVAPGIILSNGLKNYPEEIQTHLVEDLQLGVRLYIYIFFSKYESLHLVIYSTVYVLTYIAFSRLFLFFCHLIV